MGDDFMGDDLLLIFDASSGTVLTSLDAYIPKRSDLRASAHYMHSSNCWLDDNTCITLS